jgi:metal-responsive CopG/Arc/MetJ family transcriptional regulator
VKVAVSIPDDVFARAEVAAAQRGVSRSRLYAEALRAMLDRDDEITRRLDEVYADDAQEEQVAFARAASRSLLPLLDEW